MELYLVQHGQARPETEDPQRSLTERGVEDVGRVASLAVERFGVRPVRVVHSGKTRARQTAEIWGALLSAGVDKADDLAPNDDPTIWIERLDSEGPELMVVGHLPHLARLAGLLLTGAPDPSPIQFHPGGLVGLERTDSSWVVTLLLPP